MNKNINNNQKDVKNKNKRSINISRIVILLIIIILLIAGIMVLKKRKDNNDDYIYTETKNISEVVKNNTSENQQDISLTNIEISKSGATINVKAKLTNNAERIKKANVTLYLYDSDNDMRGKNTVKVENIGAGASIDTYNSIIGGYTDLSKYELKIENIER